MKAFLSPVVVFLAVALVLAIAASQFLMRDEPAPVTAAPIDAVMSPEVPAEVPMAETALPQPTPAPSEPVVQPVPLMEVKEEDRLLLGALKQSGQHATLLKAIEAAGLQETLTGKDSVTIFAPIDSAFAELPAATLENLLKPENKEVLTRLLQRHIVPGPHTLAGINERLKVTKIKFTSQAGSDVSLLKLENGAWVIETAYGERSAIVRPDQRKLNGVVQSIDRILSQSSPSPKPAAAVSQPAEATTTAP